MGDPEPNRKPSYDPGPIYGSTYMGPSTGGLPTTRFDDPIVQLVDKALNNPVTEVLDAIPPGESTGHPGVDRAIYIIQIIREGWNRVKKLCQ
jgi:hypothetical protein